MEYNADYQSVVTTILNIIENTGINNQTEKYRAITSGLYNDINNAMMRIKKMFVSNKINIYTLTNNFEVSSFSSQFMPIKIQENIKNDVISQTIYTGYIEKQKIIVKLGVIKGTIFTEPELKEFAYKIFSWLCVCNKYSKQICKGFNTIEIYFTRYKKGFPNNSAKILDPENINSGYSYVCSPSNTLVVFRLEEWFKVFIHESLHSYGLQPMSHIETTLDTAVNKLLPIKSHIHVCEAYVETWARIINAMYSAIYNSNNENDFQSIFEFTIRMESLFSLTQSYRVLAYMNLSYSQVIDPSSEYASRTYREKTNTFSYYVLCGAYMFNPYMFMKWCKTYNENILQFNNTVDGGKRFELYTIRSLQEDGINKTMMKFSHLANRKYGLRMSLVDI